MAREQRENVSIPGGGGQFSAESKRRRALICRTRGLASATGKPYPY
jgi:hypothetical protein